jgi:hypothetical protein
MGVFGQWMISISVCILNLGVLWCVLRLRTAYGRKRCILMIGVGAGLQGLWWRRCSRTKCQRVEIAIPSVPSH